MADSNVRADETAARGERVWGLWRRLKTYFPAWSLLPSAFVTPGAWTMIGIDLLSGLRRNRSTRQTFDLLEGVPQQDFDALVALAALNMRRQEIIFHAVALAYITVPVTLLATSAEIAPDNVEALLRAHVGASIQVFATCTVGVLLYFASFWRSRQMIAVLDLVRIERGLTPYTALELRDGG